MSAATVVASIELAVIVALIAVLVTAQVRGEYMDRRRLWGTPVILAVAGAVYLPLTVPTLVPADAPLAVVELVVSAVVGLGLGALTTLQFAAAPDRHGRFVKVRTGRLGGALWILFIVNRLAMLPMSSMVHAQLVASAGASLILAAVVRAVAAIVVAPRLARAERDLVTSRPPGLQST